jgi:hypothetical protein
LQIRCSSARGAGAKREEARSRRRREHRVVQRRFDTQPLDPLQSLDRDDAGVRVYPLSRFSFDRPSSPGLVIGYGVIPTPKIDEGLRRLRECFAARR